MHSVVLSSGHLPGRGVARGGGAGCPVPLFCCTSVKPSLVRPSLSTKSEHFSKKVTPHPPSPQGKILATPLFALGEFTVSSLGKDWSLVSHSFKVEMDRRIRSKMCGLEMLDS